MFMVLSCALAASGEGQPASRASATDTSAVQRGKEFFAGHRPLRNGGPACSSCHSIAGLAFPNGKPKLAVANPADVAGSGNDQ